MSDYKQLKKATDLEKLEYLEEYLNTLLNLQSSLKNNDIEHPFDIEGSFEDEAYKIGLYENDDISQ